MLPRLRISDNKRFIQDENGKPFFWLADTAWELFHRLTREECTYYFENRALKGFTVIQAVVLAELDGLRIPNMYGDVPFQNLDPHFPNENYFQHVDWVLKEAEQWNLYVALLPTWGDKVNQRYDWAKGPEVFTIDNVKHYGSFLGRRYAKQTNIVWVSGGDRYPDDKGMAIWRSLAYGIIEGVGDKAKTILTFHPQPFETGSSSRWFHEDDWLDFNMLQTGHDKQKNTFDYIKADYDKTPTKPVLDGEPTYEAHPLSFNAAANGYSSDVEVRKYAYWSLFAGGCGYTYGCHSIWQFYTSKHEGVNGPLYTWQEALNLAGACQMVFLKQLMTSRNPSIRIPDQDLVSNNHPKGEHYITAARAQNGAYGFVYSPTGKSFHINTTHFPSPQLRCRWFNPRDGSYTIEGFREKEPLLFFKPPTEGYGQDWVLVIDAYQ